ncbi:MAG: non-homologous end-joining DNA ligase [Syntrophobacteraceae bacterium]|jgi:bifunctional non-homologous end joining protein LigD
MGLEAYREKRRFGSTPEPQGKAEASPAGNLYIIQKHAASHLHYDLRLELDGVLKSWAVPKGPSLKPAEKRLAVHVEDHPIEYGSFEGIIPEGEYGGGTVMLWDRGAWEPEGDPREGYAKGDLKFKLHGEKLNGSWVLARMKGRAGGDGGKNWLLIKKRDDAAISGSEPEPVETMERSAASGRTMQEIASQREKFRGQGEAAVQGRVRNEVSQAKSVRSKSGNGGVEKNPTDPKRNPSSAALSNPNRVFYPEIGVTKRALAEYYTEIADWIMPHLARRPLTLVRCPEGWEKECFFQKHLGGAASEVLRSIPIMEKDGLQYYSVADNIDGVIELVQIGALEIHVWGSREDKLEQPDMMIFDLDPAPEAGWASMLKAARLMRERLSDLGLASFAKTTGGKGLHIVAPLTPKAGWETVKSFSRAIAESIVREAPGEYIATMSKEKRKGKIFIDYLRNGRGATSIAAYSTRRKQGAPVSTPVAWDELTVDLKSDSYNIQNIRRRLADLEEDPWAGYFSIGQEITQEMKKKVGI